ncbi:MAG: hypothetical protein QOI07_1438 [Verrucomicrobiota bacterium]|jgi:hypothetical protein
MNLTSSRNFVLTGFLISLLSVAFNSIVLSSIGRRLQALDAESNRLTESLANQAAELSEGDSLFDQYRIMHNLVLAVPPAKAKDARQDAEAILKRFLTKYYAAAHDIPRTEITRVEVEEAGQVLPLLEKGLELTKALQASANPEERGRLAIELAKLSQSAPEPKSELGRKLREIQKYSQAEYADNDLVVMSSLMPVMKSFREEIVDSIQKKENRKRELERERSALAQKANYASYAAITFQLFGLMLILTRDLVKEQRSLHSV